MLLLRFLGGGRSGLPPFLQGYRGLCCSYFLVIDLKHLRTDVSPAHTLAETYPHTLMVQHQKRHGQQLVERRRISLREVMTRVIIRPVLLFSEPIICFSCTFLAVQYGIYYLFFQAYPIIFDGKSQ